MEKQYISEFVGYVNDQKFTNRQDMEAYIGKLICAGKPINQISFGTNVRAANNTPLIRPQVLQEPQGRPARNFVADIEQDKPSYLGKQTFMEWLVPYIKEDAFILASSTRTQPIEAIVDDTNVKLNARMDAFVNLVAARLHDESYSKEDKIKYLLELRDRLSAKSNWCAERLKFYNDLIDASKGDDELVNLWACELGAKVYQTTYGFCAAFVDVLSDHIDSMK